MRLPASLSVTSCAALAASFALLSPAPVQAYGGTFGEVGPVEQSSQTVLFWIDEAGGSPHTEVHIQIQYEGEPDGFAWIVPVPRMPEVQVGSQQLFDNLAESTSPALNVDTRFNGDCVSSGCGRGFIADDGFDDFSFEDEAEGFNDDEGPEVIDRGFAGVFEYELLTADSADVIVEWLDQAGYAPNAAAPPILAEYVEAGFVFVAFKLRGGIGVDQTHPLVLRYPGREPSIPIRLTRIAATDDMAIRAYFLGQDRVVPHNWSHVELNWAKLDWIDSPGAVYRQLVSAALDEAGGRAFVTEYAGTDAVVSVVGLDHPRWNSAVFEGIEVVNVVPQLISQGLMTCDSVGCSFAHPQLASLLERYLPVPADMSAGEFYACVECFEGLIDTTAWMQAPGFAAEFQQRITGPGYHAVEMLSDSVYLTRLFTLLSPDEMSEDPEFHETSSLDTVANNIVVMRVNSCDETPSYVEFDDGRKVALDFESYPSFEDMPFAARVEQLPASGAPLVEADNRSEIDDIIDVYNRGKLIGPSPWTCSTGRMRPESVLAMLALFGLAWWQRRPSRT